MNKKIRVLQINAGNGGYGGVSSFLFQLYSYMKHDRFQFVFLSPYHSTYTLVRDKIEQMGGEVVDFKVSGPFLKRTWKVHKSVRLFIKQNHFDIIHINSGSIFFNFLVSDAARKAGAQKIIVHSHNGGDGETSRIRYGCFQILKLFIQRNANYLFACSNKAAEYMFTKKAVLYRAHIIHNGINVERFCRDTARRNQLRNANGLSDKFVVGNIGRMVAQKNQLFLVDVFERIHNLDEKAVLIIYGDGELKEEIREAINEKGLSDYVIIHDPTDQIEDAYLMMDVFVLPSLYEGLPICGIEAQSVGVPVVFSDTITREVRINENVRFLSLDDGFNNWAQEILNLKSMFCENGSDSLRKSGYSMKNVAKKMMHYYEKMLGCEEI